MLGWRGWGCLFGATMLASSACAAGNPAYDSGGNTTGGGGSTGATSTVASTASEGGGGGTGVVSTGGGAGTTGGESDGGLDTSGTAGATDTDSPRPVVVQCPDVVWAINDSGNLRLINLEAMTTTPWAELPFGAWAAATLTNGRLLLVEHLAPSTAYIFDFVENEAVKVETDVMTAAEMSRATTDEAGKVWLAAADSGEMWILDIAAPMRTELLAGPGMRTITAGDHAFLPDGTLQLVGFDGKVLLLDPPQMDVIGEMEDLGLQGPADFTGIVVDTEDEIIVSDVTGDIYRLEGGPQIGWGLQLLYTAAQGIDDLAVVRAVMGQCPE